MRAVCPLSLFSTVRFLSVPSLLLFPLYPAFIAFTSRRLFSASDPIRVRVLEIPLVIISLFTPLNLFIKNRFTARAL